MKAAAITPPASTWRIPSLPVRVRLAASTHLTASRTASSWRSMTTLRSVLVGGQAEQEADGFGGRERQVVAGPALALAGRPDLDGLLVELLGAPPLGRGPALHGGKAVVEGAVLAGRLTEAARRSAGPCPPPNRCESCSLVTTSPAIPRASASRPSHRPEGSPATVAASK